MTRKSNEQQVCGSVTGPMRWLFAALVVTLALVAVSSPPVEGAHVNAAVVGGVSLGPIGGYPSAIGANSSTNRIYVGTGGNLTVIDGGSNTIVGTIPSVGSGGPVDIAVNESTNRVYVTNAVAGTVSVVDGVLNALSATIPVAPHPTGVAVNASTNRIYVSSNGNYGTTVAVIDGATNAEIDTDGFPGNGITPIDVGTMPLGVALNAVTNRIYVATPQINAVAVIDGVTNGVLVSVPVGATPRYLASNPASNRIYSSNTDGTVSSIDGLTHAVSSVPVGGFPDQLAVNPYTNRVYVGNSSANVVTVINGATNAIVTSVPGGGRGIGVNTATNRVYAGLSSIAAVSVVDGALNYIVASVVVGTGAQDVEANPATGRIYVSNSYTNSVSVIDGVTQTIVASVPTGAPPRGVAVNPATKRIYVTSGGTLNLVIVIDGDTNGVVTSIPLPGGSGPLDVAVNPVTNRIYVTDVVAFRLIVIDGAANLVIAEVPLPDYPFYVAVNPATNRVYVSMPNNEHAVSVIDGATNAEIDTDGFPGNGITRVNVGGAPVGLAVNPNTNRIYVADGATPKVSMVDGLTHAIAPILLGSAPERIAVNAASNRIYATHSSTNTISVINGATNALLATLPVGTYPGDIAVNEGNDRAYVVNQRISTLSVIGEPDSDGDGIADSIDWNPGAAIPPFYFTDVPGGGTTSADIGAPGGLSVQAWELPNPSGVWVQATGSGPAKTITGCAPLLYSVTLTPGDGAHFKCSSGILEVYSGPIEVQFGTIPATLPSGANMTVEERSPGNFDVSTTSGSSGAITVGGLSVTPGQTVAVTDLDGDGLVNQADPDDDGDVVNDVDEGPCGGNPLNASLRPERIDGAFATVDDDGDTLVDEALPGGASAYDCDGDGFSGNTERSVFSAADTRDDQDPCGNAWPADFNDDHIVDISDVNMLAPPVFFTTSGAWFPRRDIAPDGIIDISDVNRLAPPMFFRTCTP